MLAYLPFTDRSAGGGIALWVGAACLAFASASVVNGLNAGASVLCSDEADAEQTGELVKGRTMGAFRSAGQLGRALGPIFGTCIHGRLIQPSLPASLLGFLTEIFFACNLQPAPLTGCLVRPSVTQSTACRLEFSVCVWVRWSDASGSCAKRRPLPSKRARAPDDNECCFRLSTSHGFACERTK